MENARRWTEAAAMALSLAMAGSSLAADLGVLLVEGTPLAEERLLLVPWRPFLGVELHLGRARGVVDEAVAGVLDALLAVTAERSVLPLPRRLAAASLLFGPGGGGALRLHGGVDAEELRTGLISRGFGVEAAADGGLGFSGGNLEGWIEHRLLWARWGPELAPGCVRGSPPRGTRLHRLRAPRRGCVLRFWLRRPRVFLAALEALLPIPVEALEGAEEWIAWGLQKTAGTGSLTLRVELGGARGRAAELLVERLEAATKIGPELRVRINRSAVVVEWAIDLPAARARLRGWVGAFRGWLGLPAGSARAALRLEGQGGEIADDPRSVRVDAS